MSGYLKLARPEKVQKIHADYQSQIAAKGLENTTAHITLEMMLVQSFQDPMAAEQHLEKVIQMNDKYEKETQRKSLIGIYLRQHQIGQIFQVQQDFALAINLTLTLIQDIIDYFEGNELNEALADPYLIASSIYIQLQQIQQAAIYLKKAEDIVAQFSGEINDKMIEILNQKIHLLMLAQQFEPAANTMAERNKLALSVYGLESE